MDGKGMIQRREYAGKKKATLFFEETRYYIHFLRGKRNNPLKLNGFQSLG